MLELLKELCALRGTSGDESLVREAIIEKIKEYCTYHVDALGNLIAFKKGARPSKNKIQISAHMDEVGFIVTCVDKDGLVRFASVGGIQPAVVVGKHLLIGDNEIPGVVGLKPVHLCTGEEKDEMPKMENLAIDIGAKNGEEAGQYVKPGDRAVFDSPLIAFGRDSVMGRALDDRAGCAMMVELIRHSLPVDCYFTFTVQEETGCAGGETASFAVEPDIGIALEATTAGDIEGTPDHKKVCRLGEGPVISFMDKGTIYAQDLYRAAFDAAQDCGATCQAKQYVAGGNESRSIQTARSGARVLAISLPCRYIHSPCCVLRLSDVQETMKLLPVIIEKFAEI